MTCSDPNAVGWKDPSCAGASAGCHSLSIGLLYGCPPAYQTPPAHLLAADNASLCGVVTRLLVSPTRVWEHFWQAGRLVPRGQYFPHDRMSTTPTSEDCAIISMIPVDSTVVTITNAEGAGRP